MVERVLIALEAAVLALWAGAMAGFAFVFAPIAIRIVPEMGTFAALIGAFIRGLSSFGAACGAIAIAASIVRGMAPEARKLAAGRVALVVVGLVASAYETTAIIPRMEATAAQIPGAIDSVPKTDPRRAAYDEQHHRSTQVYGLAFLCVLAATVLVPFGRRR
jgi:carbohydrate-binding DOMON domain-containing protein